VAENTVTAKLSSSLLPGCCVDRRVEWQRILGQPSYPAVYYLAVGVDRKVER
jgi:hypothetical protein